MWPLRAVGYGASGEPRPDVAKRLGADSALFSGFNFIFEVTAAATAMRRPRLFVLSSDGWAAELRGGIEPVAMGSVRKLSNTEHSGVILGGNWSWREQWGVWSSGHQATIIFDASSLPDRFSVAIRANLFPPGPSPIQTVRVSDERGNLLTIISNEQPNVEFTVKMQKSFTQQGPWQSLVFDIDNPMSPQELGISRDRRPLGIGLISLRFCHRESYVRRRGTVSPEIRKNAATRADQAEAQQRANGCTSSKFQRSGPTKAARPADPRTR